MTVEPTPRNLHYGAFYGLADLDVADDRPLLLVHGNCQAESLRVLLDGRHGHHVRTARLVPAHELTAHDVPHLQRLLARATYLVTQPVVDGYRGLPVGSAQLLAAFPHLRPAVVPVLRWAGLHPTQVIVRSSAGDPPVVPYHDLRTIAACASGGTRPRLSPESVAALRDLSLRELTRRIEAHGAVPVASSFTTSGRRPVHVVNHPTNEVLTEVADAVAARLDLGDALDVDPGRVLLGSIIAPVDPLAAELADVELGADDVAGLWRVHGEAVADEDVVEQQTRWYAEHPQALDAAVTRHAEALCCLERAA